MEIEHDIQLSLLTRQCQVTPNGINIFSAAFSCVANLYEPPVEISNRYYWRGRNVFNHRALPDRPGDNFQGLALPANGNDEISTSFSLPLPDTGAALSETLQMAIKLPRYHQAMTGPALKRLHWLLHRISRTALTLTKSNLFHLSLTSSMMERLAQETISLPVWEKEQEILL